MKKHIYSAALSLAAAAALTACGGGGDTDIGSKVVEVSIDEPIGILEAGRLITVKGTASSSSGKLSTMKWTASGAGASGSGLTLTNADCADRLESNSSFANGASNWSCTLTFQAPKLLLAATTYELGLSAVGADFSGQNSRTVTIKPASKEADQVQVSIAPNSTTNRAGEAILVTGTIASTNSRVSAAQWRVAYAGTSNEPNATALTPALTNADCADHTTNYHPAGQEAETWTCQLKLVVPPRLASDTNYKLILSGTNANGNTVTGSQTLPVQVAVASANKVKVELDAAPTTAESSRAIQAGNKISLYGTITTTNSELVKNPDGTYKAEFGVYKINGINPAIGPNDPEFQYSPPIPATTQFTTICRENANPTAATHVYRCVGQLLVSSVSQELKTITYFLSGTNDEGFSNHEVQDLNVAVDPNTASPFGLRATVGYSPQNVVSGQTVNLACQISDPIAGANYRYSWRVADSKGYMLNLSGGVTTSGAATMVAPVIPVDPADPTAVVVENFVVECGVSANNQPAKWFPVNVRVSSGSAAPTPALVVAAPTATVNPVVAGGSTSLTCSASGGAPVTAGQYTYTWSVVSNPGNVVNTLTGTPFTGATSTATFATTAGATGTVGLQCSANDGAGHTATNNISIVVN